MVTVVPDSFICSTIWTKFLKSHSARASILSASNWLQDIWVTQIVNGRIETVWDSIWCIAWPIVMIHCIVCSVVVRWSSYLSKILDCVRANENSSEITCVKCQANSHLVKVFLHPSEAYYCDWRLTISVGAWMDEIDKSWVISFGR